MRSTRDVLALPRGTQAIVILDEGGSMTVWVDSTQAAFVAFVALAGCLREDDEAPEHVRNVAHRVAATLGDEPTERGPR